MSLEFDLLISTPVYVLALADGGYLLTDNCLLVWTDSDAVETFLERSREGTPILEQVCPVELSTDYDFLRLLQTAHRAGIAEAVIDPLHADQQMVRTLRVPDLIQLLDGSSAS